MFMLNKDFQKLLLEAEMDGFNAGLGKKIRRVKFCKLAKWWVIQQKVGKKEWLCLHK